MLKAVEAHDVPSPRLVKTFLELAASRPRPGSKAGKTAGKIALQTPAIKPVAAYLLRAALPRVLSEMYDRSAADLEDKPFFDDTYESHIDKVDAYSNIDSTETDTSLEAIPGGFAAMLATANEWTDDV